MHIFVVSRVTVKEFSDLKSVQFVKWIPSQFRICARGERKVDVNVSNTYGGVFIEGAVSFGLELNGVEGKVAQLAVSVVQVGCGRASSEEGEEGNGFGKDVHVE